MSLPENATDNDSLLSSSVPYGSLNESQFRHPRHHINNPNSTHGLKHHEHNNNNNTSKVSFSLSNDYYVIPPQNQQQQNLQGQKSYYYDIQQRVQNMKNNGTLIKNETKSGLALLLGDNDDKDNMNEAKGVTSNGKGNGTATGTGTGTATGNASSTRQGIGALVEGIQIQPQQLHPSNQSQSHSAYAHIMSNQEGNHQSSLPTSIKFGSSVNTHTSMLTSSSAISTLTSAGGIIGGGAGTTTNTINTIRTTNEATATRGIAVPLQVPFSNSNNNNNNNADNSHEQSYDPSANHSYNTGMTTINNNNITNLSRSLTGLDILKQTPKCNSGMFQSSISSTNYDDCNYKNQYNKETKAIMLDIQARSRSYSEDINKFLTGDRERHYDDDDDYQELGLEQLEQRQQRRLSNDSDNLMRDIHHHHHNDDDDGIIGGRGSSEYNNDTDGAFDFDLDC